MANALRDENRVPTLVCASNVDGSTIVPVKVNAVTNGLSINNGNGGTDHGRPEAVRDEDRVPVLMAVSSVDGVTPVEVYADINGGLLVTTL